MALKKQSGMALFLLIFLENRITENQKKQRNAIPCFFLFMLARRAFYIYESEREGFIMADIQFDYFTAAETEQYTFYRIPKALFTESHFQGISCEAKSMMLDRLGLSIRNQWFDSQGRAYIIFTVEDVMGVMGCQSQKAVRLMKELDTADGIGLIEKKRIGLGRPNRIYVKNFMVRGNGGMETRTGGACRTQPHTADNPHSAGISRKKAAAPEEPLYCAGTMPEMKADAEKENKAGTTAAAMPETQEDQELNWRVRGENISENERPGKADDSICREESGAYEENWWDMEKDAASGIKKSWQGTPLCKSSAGAGMDIGSVTGIADAVDIVDNVDNCRAAGNFMYEYQNPELGTRSGEHIFADKTVEAMVREMLGEQKTGPSGDGFKCVLEPGIQNGGGQDALIVETEMPKQRDSKRNDTEYSKTEINKTEKNKTDFSAVYSSCQSYSSYPSCQSSRTDLPGQHAQGRNQAVMPADSRMDGIERKIDSYREYIRENIDYQCFRPQDAESVDELVELMADTMMVSDRGTVRIAGGEKPAPIVKSHFMKLAHSHIEYVIECLQRHTGKIRNIKAYILTALYNSSLTIGSYYRAEVNHDLYGRQGCVC